MSRDALLTYHLQHNHVPSVHPMFVPSAAEAVDAVNDGNSDWMVELPNGVTLSSGEIVEQLHLDCFLDLEPAL